jgi:hypothetical protein
VEYNIGKPSPAFQGLRVSVYRGKTADLPLKTPPLPCPYIIIIIIFLYKKSKGNGQFWAFFGLLPRNNIGTFRDIRFWKLTNNIGFLVPKCHDIISRYFDEL